MRPIKVDNAVEAFGYWGANVENTIRRDATDEQYFSVRFNITAMKVELETICKAIRDGSIEKPFTERPTEFLMEIRNHVTECSERALKAAEEADDTYMEVYVDKRSWQTPFKNKWNEIMLAVTVDLNGVLARRLPMR